MKLKRKTSFEIKKILAETEVDFKKRCDVVLKEYTGKSFVKDHEELWKIVSKDRKTYRHRIVHSDKSPNKNETDQSIKNFENAIRYIKSL